jgi:CysZ protein
MSDLIIGFRYPFTGFNLVIRPGIRLYLIVPLLVNTLIFSAIIYYGATQISDLIDWLGQQWSWLSWIAWLVWPLFLILSLTLVFLCFSVFANLIAAPFNGFLAESVERFLAHEQGHELLSDNNPVLNVAEILRSMRSEFKKFLFILIRTLPILVLFVIPVVQLAAPMIWIIFIAWMMALEYLEYPMGNHGMLFNDVRTQISAKRNLAMGFGFAVSLLTIIPIINFIAMPVAVAGATKMYLEKF